MVLHELLVEHVQDRLAGDVGHVGGALHGGAAEGAQVELARLVAVEGDPDVLEVQDLLGRLGAHDLDRVLVAEEVRALDGVVGVRAPVVVHADRGVDPAGGGHRVRADRVDLAHDRDGRARVGRRERGALAGEAGPDDQDVVCWHGPSGVGAVGGANSSTGRGRSGLRPRRSGRARTRAPAPVLARYRARPGAAAVRARWTCSTVTTPAQPPVGVEDHQRAPLAEPGSPQEVLDRGVGAHRDRRVVAALGQLAGLRQRPAGGHGGVDGVGAQQPAEEPGRGVGHREPRPVVAGEELVLGPDGRLVGRDPDRLAVHEVARRSRPPGGR